MNIKIKYKRKIDNNIQTAEFQDQQSMDAFLATLSEGDILSTTDITAEVEAENLKKKYPAVSPRQIRLALLSQGITESMIDATIGALPSPDKEAAMIAWRYSTSFERFLPIVEQIGIALGFDSIALNTLWENARSL